MTDPLVSPCGPTHFLLAYGGCYTLHQRLFSFFSQNNTSRRLRVSPFLKPIIIQTTRDLVSNNCGAISPKLSLSWFQLQWCCCLSVVLTVVLVPDREISTITNSDGNSSSNRKMIATVHVEGIVTICSNSSNIAVITSRSGSASGCWSWWAYW